MNKFSRTLLGTLVILVPALFAIGIIFNSLTKKSFYQNSGELRTPGITAKVKIYSDEYGVPHVFAENEHDMYFTLGYMHAQDRLWQMDITRRAAEGRLAQVLGRAVIDYDKLFRTVGLAKFSFSLFKNLSPKSKEILQAYSDGVNRFIEMHRKKLPIELDVLNYQPDEWKPEHSLMIGRLMSWDLNMNWYGDYTFRQIVAKVGIEKAAEIFPDTNLTFYKKPKPTDEDTMEAEPHAGGYTPGSFSNLQLDKPWENEAIGFLDTYIRFRTFFGLNTVSSGSNAWVVSGTKSESGKPMLANDPHLSLQAPSRWYEVHMKSGEIDVTGMTLPGVPAVIIGHTRAICWGLTNLMNDDNDFMILQKDSSNPSKYIYDGQSFYPDSSIEKIEVKDSAEVYYTIRNTKIGPVISDFKMSSKANENVMLTFRWTGYENSDELKTFYTLSKARNWEEFKSGLKDFGSPAQNFTYADTAGNIGYQAAGKIPIRKTTGGDWPLFAEDADWTGFVEFEKMPSEFNPKDSFIVTANTNPFDWLRTEQEKRFYISWTWEPWSRFDRIKEILRMKVKLTIEEFKLMQLDYRSIFAKDITKYLVEAYGDGASESAEIRDALSRMRNWDGLSKSDLPEGAVFNVFFVNLLKNIYQDELGEKIFNDFLTITNIPYRATARLLHEYDLDKPGWFDNVNSSAIETKNEIIKKSFSEALIFLTSHFSTSDINAWKWGELHQVKFMHLMGTVPELNKTFNIGPYQVGGDMTTINNAGYSLMGSIRTGTFGNDIGPSMRMITDLADIEHSLSINSTGQSAQPMHPNYADQSRLWFYGDYKEVTMDEFEMIAKGFKLLVLMP